MSILLAFPSIAPGLPAPAAPRCPDRLLAELLALNEEMIVQLNLERQSESGTGDFLARMIEQHGKAADLLRAQLAPPAEPAPSQPTPQARALARQPLRATHTTGAAHHARHHVPRQNQA